MKGWLELSLWANATLIFANEEDNKHYVSHYGN
jgi:hypothetical protein